MRYGRITVQVEPVGHPIMVRIKSADRHIPDEFWRQKFHVSLAIPGFTHNMTVLLDYHDDEEPIKRKVAAWRAIDNLRGAIKDPDEYKGFVIERKEATGAEADRTITAAFRFGEEVLDEAFYAAVSQTSRLMKAIERTGPKEWLPGTEE